MKLKFLENIKSIRIIKYNKSLVQKMMPMIHAIIINNFYIIILQLFVRTRILFKEQRYPEYVDRLKHKFPGLYFSITSTRKQFKTNISIYMFKSFKLMPTFYRGLLIELLLCHQLCRYLSSFYDSKCIQKPIKRSFGSILIHKNLIDVDRDGDIKTIQSRILHKKSALISPRNAALPLLGSPS